jgi:ribosomal protein S18 acetylase RimI-like enzyme
MSHQFTQLGVGDSDDLSKLIEIYQEAIDPSEQKRPAEIAAMLTDPRYVLIVSRTGGAVSGFAISFFPDGADFWLLEYMAVSSSMRGRRVGEAIFHETYRYGLERDQTRIMVLEVDQPGSSTNPNNDTHARFRFYRRVGCRRVAGLDYILPLDTEDTPPAMMLLTYRVPAVEAVTKIQVRHWLTRLFVDVYRKTASDPRLDVMLSPLGDVELLA